MDISNFRTVRQEEGVTTAYVDVGNSRHTRELAIVKKDGGKWIFLHDECDLPDEAQVYCDEQLAKG